MSRTWGRLYAGTRNHRKIKILREWFPDHWTKWYVILELAIECDDEGWIYVAPGVPFTPEQLAKELGFTRVKTSLAFTNALVTLQLATSNEFGLLVNSFAERNFESDNSLQRVKKYRDNREKMGLSRGSNYDRNFVLKRDRFECVYCGKTENLCVDHMLPASQGGDDDELNLACACKQCNSGKAGRTPEQAGYKIINVEAQARYSAYMSRSVTVTVTDQNRTETEHIQNRTEQSIKPPRKSKKIETSASPESPAGDNGDARPVFFCPSFEVDKAYFDKLLLEYPALDESILSRELNKMGDWLTDNPKKHKRTAKGHIKNPKMFIRNWIERMDIKPGGGKAWYE